MRREFYASWFWIIIKIVFLVLAISTFIGSVKYLGKTKEDKFAKFDKIFGIVMCATGAIGIIHILRSKDEPVVVVSTNSIIYRHGLGADREVNFARIDSAVIFDKLSFIAKCIKIHYRNDKNKAKSFSIPFYEIKNPKELISVLRQVIKCE